jgi:ABC-type dipeptide/oligopeptide/nickel transport system permease subunit
MANRNTFKKFTQNRLAYIGSITIMLFIVLALFAYVIAPDNSTFGNRQIIELNSLPPGSSYTLLKIPKENITAPHLSFIQGYADTHTYIPVNTYKQIGDSIQIEQFVSEDTSVQKTYYLQQLQVKNVQDALTKKTFYLGTDKLGRDILSRLIIGTRVSLLVGLIAAIISLLVGILLGMLAGYYGKWVDGVIMWFINVVWSIPTILLVFAFTILLGKGIWQVFIAVGLTMWVNVARLVRGQVLEIKNLQYIEAAKVLGFSNMRIMFKHILPNILGPIMVMAAANFATAIILESGLSFLGIGVQAPQPSWGLMIKENYNLIITNSPMLALAPGFAIMLLVLAFNMVGNGLRDALDVKA